MKNKIPGVKLICGVIFNQKISSYDIKRALEEEIGAVDFSSREINFNYTDYYRSEMGKELKRLFFSFKKLQSPERLHRVKLKTREIEKRFLRNGKRRVNLDPGYMELSKLILFSFKNFSHRIYAAEDVYAELTLSYRGGEFCSLPWTFPDYSSPEYKEILGRIRDIYRKQLKENGC